MTSCSAPVCILCGCLIFLGCSRQADQAGAADHPRTRAQETAEDTRSRALAPETTTAQGDSIVLPATNLYEIIVPQGTMVIRLYDETPLHRDNFKRLVEEGVLDGTLFHRVIAGLMIQGGDPNSKDEDPMNDGQGDPGYTVPAEIVPGLYHKRGAVAAARTGDHVNPERRSSGSQFYIVQGTVLDEPTLAAIEERIRQSTRDPDFRFSTDIRETYLEVGGAPSLDMQYTVFGEVVEGLDVLDAVSGVATPASLGDRIHPALMDRPVEPVPMIVRPRQLDGSL